MPDAEVSIVQEAARFLPVGLLYSLTVPHPWQFGSLRQNLIIPETVFWIMLYPLIAVGFTSAFRQHPAGTLYIVFVTAGLGVIYAVLAGNVGTAYRMRSQAWLLWAPFAAWGFQTWRDRTKRAPAAGRGAVVFRRKRPRLGRYASGEQRTN